MEITKNQLKTVLAKKPLDANQQDYVNYHLTRYMFLLKLVDQKSKLNNFPTQPYKILDIGPAFQTYLLREFFPISKVFSLGSDHPFNELREGELHFKLDINDTLNTNSTNIQQKFDLIIMGEVIEHIYIPPHFFLRYLKNLLLPNGRIIIQTPNAIAIHKRIKMLFGIHPYMLLQEDCRGHFREYTIKELQKIVECSGLDSIHVSVSNYFGYDKNLLHKILKI